MRARGGELSGLRRLLAGFEPQSSTRNPGAAPRTVESAWLVDKLAVARAIPTGSASVAASRMLGELAADGTLLRVRRGLYLNLAAEPRPVLAEAAALVRTGAVVSLASVLGEAGIINNPTGDIFAVLPAGMGANSGHLEFELEGGHDGAPVARFHFYQVANSGLDNANPCDLREDPVGYAGQPLYARATPEAALVHWMHLGMSPRSPLTPPPHELDLDGLDLDRLNRLACQAGLEPQISDLVDRARALDQVMDTGADDGGPAF